MWSFFQRRWIFYLLICVVISPLFFTKDFLRDHAAYWAGFQLFVRHLNPYDPALLSPIQTQIMEGFFVPQIPLSIPIRYLIFFPVYSCPYQISRIMIFILNGYFLATIISGAWNFSGCQSPKFKHMVAGCLLMPFMGRAIFLSTTGLIAIFGLTRFFLDVENKKYFRAGMFLLLTLMQFAIFLPIYFIGCIWIVKQKRWDVAAGFVLTTGGLLWMLVCFYPEALLFWWRSRSIAEIHLFPTLASWSKHLIYNSIGLVSRWPDLVMISAGCLYAFLRFIRHENFVWREELPWLCCISLVVSPYMFAPELILLCIPSIASLHKLIQLWVAGSHKRLFLLWGAIQMGVIGSQILISKTDEYYVWLPIVSWLCWEYLSWRTRRDSKIGNIR